jgi:UvrD-like helicase C-terminal domain/ATP-dependent RecD-like DNA helicase SH3 domain
MGSPSGASAGRVYRVGDKVMQLRNNYDKGTAGVFNGSVGVVTTISLEEQELRVRLDEDEEVAYGFDELDELTHAYAVSIHHSQGSEYPCVAVPVTTSAWLMLQRNLLYTAVTRAKRIVVLVGSRRALAKAVRTQGAGRRYTALPERLQSGSVGATADANCAAACQRLPAIPRDRPDQLPTCPAADRASRPRSRHRWRAAHRACRATARALQGRRTAQPEARAGC